MALADLEHSFWNEVDAGAFAAAWDEELKSLPETRVNVLHLVTGLLLPVWQKLPRKGCRIFRLTTTEGERLIGLSSGMTILPSLKLPSALTPRTERFRPRRQSTFLERGAPDQASRRSHASQSQGHGARPRRAGLWREFGPCLESPWPCQRNHRLALAPVRSAWRRLCSDFQPALRALSAQRPLSWPSSSQWGNDHGKHRRRSGAAAGCARRSRVPSLFAEWRQTRELLDCGRRRATKAEVSMSVFDPHPARQRELDRCHIGRTWRPRPSSVSIAAFPPQGAFDEARAFLNEPLRLVAEPVLPPRKRATGASQPRPRTPALARSWHHRRSLPAGPRHHRRSRLSSPRLPGQLLLPRRGQHRAQASACAHCPRDRSCACAGVNRTWLRADGGGKADLPEPRKRLANCMATGSASASRASFSPPAKASRPCWRCAVLPHLPSVAALSAAHLGALRLPDGLKRLYIACDNDRAGLDAGLALASRAISQGIASGCLCRRGKTSTMI